MWTQKDCALLPLLAKDAAKPQGQAWLLRSATLLCIYVLAFSIRLVGRGWCGCMGAHGGGGGHAAHRPPRTCLMCCWLWDGALLLAWGC